MRTEYKSHLVDLSVEEFRDKSGWQVTLKISQPTGDGINYWPRVILPTIFATEAEGLAAGLQAAKDSIADRISGAS